MNLEVVFKDERKETFDNVEIFTVTEKQDVVDKNYGLEVAQIPTEGKLFEVNPLGIDRRLFEDYHRGNVSQELTRQTILEAFTEVDKYPEKYAIPFYTLIPEKDWGEVWTTIQELKEYANDWGGNITFWVEQAMEWAQRICNGESWENICNKPDTARWRRIILWKDGSYRDVGGSSVSKEDFSASDVNIFVDAINTSIFHALAPLITIRKK